MIQDDHEHGHRRTRTRTRTPPLDRGAPRLGDHRRSQEDRHHVHPHGRGLPRDRRGRGAGDALSAPVARVQGRAAGYLQSDDDDARHHDDLLRGHADPGRRRQLHRAAADRGPRHGLSAAQCPGLVGDAVRRHPGLFQLRHRRRAGHRLVRLRPADRTHLLARRGHRLLDPRPAGQRHRQRVGRHQPRHHGADAALPGHDLAQGAALHLDGVLGQRADPLRHCRRSPPP